MAKALPDHLVERSEVQHNRFAVQELNTSVYVFEADTRQSPD